MSTHARERRVPASVDLSIGGMSCASCVGRVESALNAVDGARASVNLALGSAVVEYDADRAGVAELVAAVESAGYRAHPDAVGLADDGDGGLARRLVVVGALAAPVIAVSMVPPLQFDYWQWPALLAAAVVVLWGGWPFISGAVSAARHRTASMDTLVAIGSLTALIWSAVAIVALDAGGPDVRMSFSFDLSRSSEHAEIYLEVAVGIVALILLGRWLERRARRQAGAALRGLLEGAAPRATVLRQGVEVELPAAELEAGDLLVVRPGERLAADGRVSEGRTAVDASVITGESVPVDVAPGDAVTGGSINLGGRLIVEATRVGADTLIAQMARVVAEAQSSKSRFQRLADRISAVFVPIVLVVSALTLVGWLAAGQPLPEAGTAAVAVLVIACPCALGLATPAALLAGTGRGAELGILIRGPEVLERARRVTLVALDKTGTLTTGSLSLGRVVPLDGRSGDDALGLAASLAAGSEHPVARAIVRAADERGLGREPVEAFTSTAGHGVTGHVGGATVELRRADQPDARPDETATELLVDGEPAAWFALTDQLRPEAPEAVLALLELGVDVRILSGDRQEVVDQVAAALGVDGAAGGLDPLEKAAHLERMIAAGESVAMVGDGVNDAPALATADLGIAVGHGTDMAISAADITLTTSDPGAIARAIQLARQTRSVIVQNLVWAFGYNVLAIPLAVAGLLNPLIAAGAMAASSLFVVFNALRLRAFRPAASR